MLILISMYCIKVQTFFHVYCIKVQTFFYVDTFFGNKKKNSPSYSIGFIQIRFRERNKLPQVQVFFNLRRKQ